MADRSYAAFLILGARDTLMMDPQRSHAAGRSGGWPLLDNVTLSRLTWLWLSYSMFALATGGRRLPTACPYRLMTVRRCPLCGLTRSIHCLLRGQISSSFEQHRAGPMLYALSACFLAWAWYSRCPETPSGLIATKPDMVAPPASPRSIYFIAEMRQAAVPVGRPQSGDRPGRRTVPPAPATTARRNVRRAGASCER